MQEPLDIVFVGHGAERSGPPILLGHLQAWLDANTSLQQGTLLARGGPLVEQHRRIGPVRVRDDGSTPGHLAQRTLRRVGRHRSADRLEHGRSRSVARPLGAPRLVYANTVAPQTAGLVRSVLPDDGGFILHVHELASTLRHRINAADLRWMLGRADRIIAASDVVRRQLAERFGVDEERMVVCHEFVEPMEPATAEEAADLRRRLGAPENAPVIAASGRLDWRKAPELLAQVLWRLRQEDGDDDPWVVWVGASGDDRWQLEHDLLTMGLADRFVLAGEQEHPGDWIRGADLFALPSREDAFPLACLEAAGAGLPLVTFDTGGMVEFIDASGGGVVVGYPDVAAFADACADLLDDDDRRRALGQRAAQWASGHHSVEAGAPPIYAEIEAVLERRGR